MTNEIDDLVVFMASNEIIKFGQFKLKSGQISPIYFDFRQIVGYPSFMNRLAKLMASKIEGIFDYDLVAGVPYNGIPLATAYSLETGVPMIYHRKELKPKDYGTQKSIEGPFKSKQRVILIDDVLTTGGSVLESAKLLEDHDLEIRGVCVIVDRRPVEQQTTLSKGIQLISLFTFDEIVLILKNHPGPWQNSILEVCKLSSNSYEERLNKFKNPFAKKTWEIMHQKKTNLVLSADIVDCNDCLELVDKVGSKICIVKIHLDMYSLRQQGILSAGLEILSKKHNFLILEDRKLADIGNTVKNQVLEIGKYAQASTVHSIFGEGTIQGVQAARNDVSVLLVAQASVNSNLISAEYTKQTVDMGKKYSETVAGFICQQRLAGDEFLYFTPGVNLVSQGDELQQRYRTPEMVMSLGIDLIIVGRGITEVADPLKAVSEYQEEGWRWFDKKA